MPESNASLAFAMLSGGLMFLGCFLLLPTLGYFGAALLSLSLPKSIYRTRLEESYEPEDVHRRAIFDFIFLALGASSIGFLIYIETPAAICAVASGIWLVIYFGRYPRPNRNRR